MASRLLLVAMVRDADATVSEIRKRLRLYFDKVSEEKDVAVFDLGWSESLHSTYTSLAEIHWVSIGDDDKVRATPLGMSHVRERLSDFEGMLGSIVSEPAAK